MAIDSALLASPMLWTSHVVCGLVLIYAGLTAPWLRFRDNEQSHVYLGSIVALLVIWAIHGGISPGLSFHLLGVTAITLMLGWRLAFIAVTVALTAFTLNTQAGWQTMPVNALVLGGVPILTTELLLRLAQRRLPQNFFVYVFVNAFLAAGLSALAVGFVKSLLLVFSGTYSWAHVSYGYLAYLPMMFFAEALINGWLITIFAAYRPRWVTSFDDTRYLHGEKPHS